LDLRRKTGALVLFYNAAPRSSQGLLRFHQACVLSPQKQQKIPKAGM
jgi:hypothetical protein